ncbi:putative mitochondrial heat shock protein 70 [Leptomonas pyrrhocoris]|uniref:Putative mitochondrial heat shock protein 70 n=1 Tax=Leptomonas pyrrhocoris TaxID=157538 RepID=A0A0N0DZA9_LEPPY|nr:putative mitochondrial heat shock protein 70 [Leptomonas pyrrhocoris]XP_015663528.1 putative mitochondrial heat shock protein 70 [Leptomonas pyrrhocoris]KPA85088.1 putative mitochondrial heat shock protein 70 [Leptomonas pyrrhocoris]KPA85089.1 putative mitochondrial heat shock protein 70 [Leptomonas pyrrhocoris]|eukprot:XP_015663527.1 putative mitochondrial heat shock protein 70 [Leptomonas pyrrhocoris]
MSYAEEFDGAIGVDLGTTYSCVAVFLRGQVEVIPNDMGNRTTPSCVAFYNGDVLVGDAAKSLLGRGATGVIFDAKRMIGHRFSDKSIQEDRPRWPFPVSAGDNDKTQIDVQFKGEELHLAPEQISAKVLAYLKECAERHLGKRVRKAVITVPAYFNDAQRERTKAAATIAGLEPLRILNEPTAAALCYGLGIGSGTGEQQGADKPHNVVVFDFGGGTFDVSVITIDCGSFAVRATAGDTHLGGQDIDSKLLQFVLKDIQNRFQVNVAEQPRLLAKARTVCERVKRTLSHSTTEELALDGVLANGEEYTVPISRAKLEELNASLFEQCMRVVQRALKDAGMKIEDIDEVVLVGGSSRIPKLNEMLKAFFKKEKLCNSVHPDEAVAIGAAVQASILTTSPEQQSEKTASVVLMDVVPLSIGVEIDNGKFDVIIPRNTTIPYKATKEYSTVEDYQEDVDVYVYEGERPLTKHNHKLGEFTLEGITRAKQGVPTITVTFSIDANGLLTITGTEEVANKKQTLVVQNDERLSEKEVQEMIETAKKFSREDAVDGARAAAKRDLEAALETLSAAIVAMPQPPSVKLQKRLDAFVPRTHEWIARQLPSYTTTAEVEEKTKKIAKLAKKALKKVQKEASGDAPAAKRHRSENGEDAAPKSSDDSDDES